MHMGAEGWFSAALQLKVDGGAAADRLYLRHVYAFGIYRRLHRYSAVVAGHQFAVGGRGTTLEHPPLWPTRGLMTGLPVSASQILTVLSSDPEATRFPSRENATELISLV